MTLSFTDHATIVLYLFKWVCGLALLILLPCLCLLGLANV